MTSKDNTVTWESIVSLYWANSHGWLAICTLPWRIYCRAKLTNYKIYSAVTYPMHINEAEPWLIIGRKDHYYHVFFHFGIRSKLNTICNIVYRIPNRDNKPFSSGFLLKGYFYFFHKVFTNNYLMWKAVLLLSAISVINKTDFLKT